MVDDIGIEIMIVNVNKLYCVNYNKYKGSGSFSRRFSFVDKYYALAIKDHLSYS